jgi:hypothetical protein
MAVIMISMYRGLFDRAVHPLDLAIGPRMVRLGETVVDVVVGACDLESMGTEELAALPSQFDVCSCGAEIARRGKVGSVVGENRVDFIGDDRDELA